MRVGLVTAAALLLAASAFAQAANPCTASGGKGDPNKNAPVVCIDPSNGDTDPVDVTAYSGAIVNFWFTNSTDDLDIRFKFGTKVKNKQNHGPNLTVEADTVTKKQAPKKYKIFNKSTNKSWDPTIIIEPLETTPVKGPRKTLYKE